MLRVWMLCGLSLGGALAPAWAQDLEPRSYTASPTGLNFLAVAAGRSTGGVLFDPSLPFSDVEAEVNSLALGYGRTFALLGRTALFVAAAPYAWADASGMVGENRQQVTRAGFVDPRMKLSVNLLGGRAMSLPEFVRSRTNRSTIVGVSLLVLPPLGEYDRTKLINLGANRWSFKPEVGWSHAVRGWTIEGYAGVWLFTANREFYTGSSVREQRPVVAIQAHASYTVRPRLWISADATWYSGGSTILDGVRRDDLQRNTRFGGTVSLPLFGQQSVKIGASTGATTRIGADFTTVAAAWQFSWFDRP